MKNKIKSLIFDSKKGKIKLNERASIFFFCLMISTFFWFLSSLSKSYTTNLTIPLEYTSYNKSFILTEDPVQNITIQVSGNGFELLGEQMRLNRNSIRVDLSKAGQLSTYRSGIATSILENEIYNSLDKDLRLERILLDSIHFKTDRRVERMLSVIPKLDLSFESSFNLIGEVLIKPKLIKVSGAKERMDTLKYLITQEIKREDISDSLKIIYDFSKDETLNGLTIEPSKIEILIPVEKFTEKVFDVPISTDGSDVSIRTFPNKVKAVFLVPLSNYEQLTESVIEAKVKINGNLRDKKTLQVKLIGTPSFARLLRIEPEKVEFIIKQ
ncbi:MAG: hypothetical protein JKY48_02680 [Flavobacteriales bacterium]|nr:hypothetical protein [Flavobacteriales bacterium]